MMLTYWLVAVMMWTGCAPVERSAPAAVTAVAAPDPAQVKLELEDLLRRVTAATGAANQDGYLACVSLADPCFATEQRNWAKDLGRHAPESFEMTLTDDPTLDADGSATARIRMAWRMPEGRARAQAYTARFVRGETGWLYAGEKWNVVEADRVKVFYEADLEDAAKNVAAVLPGVRAHVHEGFQLGNDKDLTERVQQIKLYSSMRHLQQSIYLSYSDALSGWNEPGESIKLLAHAETGRGALRALLAHEYGHVATFQLGPKANDMPWWILEGVADLSAQEYSDDWEYVDRIVKRWARSGRLIEWDRLSDFRGEATQHMNEVYTQGHHMLGYISDRFGRDQRNRWLRQMAQGSTLDQATRDVMGMPFADLDKAWRESLKD
jgi:hypothetical protein